MCNSIRLIRPQPQLISNDDGGRDDPEHRSVHGVTEHGPTVGEDQHEARVQRGAVIVVEAAMRGDERTVGRVRIGPQHLNRSSLEAVGFYDLGMVREGTRWQVTLPASTRRQAGTGGER